MRSVPGIQYHAVRSGKLRRYFSWQNFIDPFRVIVGMFQSARLMGKIRPDVVFSKGGFVAVPVVFGAWLHRIPVLCHESDLTPGLANKLCRPFARRFATTFPVEARSRAETTVISPAGASKSPSTDTPPAVVVDDFGYCITEMFMRWQDEPRYQKNKYQIYTDIAQKVYNAFVDAMTDGNVDRIVYWIMHEDQTVDDGVVPMTVGKLLNEKVNLLGMCTVTLRSMYDGENGYVYEVSAGNGKTPPGLFDGSPIEKFGDHKVGNDLKEVDAAIRRKYRKPANDGKKTNGKETK